MRRKPFIRREHPGVLARRHVGFIEMMAGKELPELRAGMPALPVKRAPRTTSTEDTEAPVLKAVGELLAVHPKVEFAVRQNGGASYYEGAGGKSIPIWFYKIVRKPEDLTIVDYWGILKDKRIYCFECKRPSWKHPHTDHEIRQWNFINMIVRAGGIGSFVRSADEVNALLP